MKFKVGDRVTNDICTNAGKLGTVTDISSLMGFLNIKYDDGKTDTHIVDHLRLVETSQESHGKGGEKHMAEFKVGDIVKFKDLDTYTGCGALETIESRKGLFVITNFSSKSIFVDRYPTHDIEVAEHCWLPSILFELASGNMTTLKELTTGQKETLSEGDQALLRAGYISDNLEMTPEGEKYLRDFLFRGIKEELEARVIKEVKEAETEAKKKKA